MCMESLQHKHSQALLEQKHRGPTRHSHSQQVKDAECRTHKNGAVFVLPDCWRTLAHRLEISELLQSVSAQSRDHNPSSVYPTKLFSGLEMCRRGFPEGRRGTPPAGPVSVNSQEPEWSASCRRHHLLCATCGQHLLQFFILDSAISEPGSRSVRREVTQAWLLPLILPGQCMQGAHPRLSGLGLEIPQMYLAASNSDSSRCPVYVGDP